MTTDQIFKLLDAGYTKSEIEALTQPEQPNPAPEPQPEPEQQPEAQDQPAQEQPGAADGMDALRAELNAAKQQITQLTQQVQQMNLEQRSTNIPPDQDIPKKADAAMTELIRPAMKKHNKEV